MIQEWTALSGGESYLWTARVIHEQVPECRDQFERVLREAQADFFLR
jgi:hypothetical protein